MESKKVELIKAERRGVVTRFWGAGERKMGRYWSRVQTFSCKMDKL